MQGLLGINGKSVSDSDAGLLVNDGNLLVIVKHGLLGIWRIMKIQYGIRLTVAVGLLNSEDAVISDNLVNDENAVIGDESMGGKSAVVDGYEVESYSNDSNNGFSIDDLWNERDSDIEDDNSPIVIDSNDDAAIVPSILRTQICIGLDKQNFQRKIVNIFLPISFNICFGCSKEPSY